MHPLEVTDKTFQNEVLDAPGLTVVDFWAPWCGPCRMIAPLIEELAGDYAGKVKFVKLNTDENYESAMRYGIRGIPTIGFFRDGNMVDTIVGAVPKRSLVDAIEKNNLALVLN